METSEKLVPSQANIGKSYVTENKMKPFINLNTSETGLARRTEEEEIFENEVQSSKNFSFDLHPEEKLARKKDFKKSF